MLYKYFLGGYDKNLSYLIWCPKTFKAALIDPAVRSKKIIKFINNNNLILDKILITHSHGDHIAYLNEFFNKYQNKIDCFISNKSSYDYYNIKKFRNNEIISIGNENIKCLLTPGHYYDSACFWIKSSNLLFTGDTIFVGRTGRTVHKGSRIKDLYNSIYNILLKLPKRTLILSGHDYGLQKFITLEDNIKKSIFFRCKNFQEFETVMNNYEKTRKIK